MKKHAIVRRNTRQKQIILGELKKTKSHPTADELFTMVRKSLPSISFATVYRNLHILKEEGKIVELALGKYSSRFDADVADHYHFFCLGCSKVFDLMEEIREDLDRSISKSSGFKVQYHRINFYGYCNHCKKRSSNKQKELIRWG